MGMDWERVKRQLEQILDAPLTIVKVNVEHWGEVGVLSGTAGKEESKSIVQDQTVLFPLRRDGLTIEALAVSEELITASERQLIDMLLEAFHTPQRRPAGTEEERRALQIRTWLQQQLENGVIGAEMPDTLATQSSMYTAKIPLLLYGDYPETKRVSYGELKKLLESFFDEDVTLIPLMDKEWLILGAESLLTDSEAGKDGEEETAEEALQSLVSGLYEMLASEWVGECHLAVHHPIVPAKSIVSAVMLLRETISLGRKYHVGANIHLPWMLRLERLLNGIPDAQKERFMEQVLKRADHVLEPETLTTLETFFQLDCSVSETAKRLYIHRNTLLYRLDRLKQETGLDVRTFSDAVLVNIILLLYKVTKRK